MSETVKKSRPVRRLVSPGGFLRMGIAMAVLFAICHAMGWRENTSYLSGSAPDGQHTAWSLAFGQLYLASYLGIAVMTPILVLAAGIFAMLVRWTSSAPLRLGERKKEISRKDAEAQREGH